MKVNMMNNNITVSSRPTLGFYVSMFGTVLILLWLGVFKFTSIEAEAIKPLVGNHPLTAWMYKIFSVRMVSNFIGAFELTVAILILIGLKIKIAGKIAALGLIVIFTMTISYLMTTPNIWQIKDHILVTNFSLIKDIMYLGFGLSLLQYSNTK